MTGRVLTVLGLLAVLTMSVSCTALRPARDPLPAHWYPAAVQPAHCLLVLLPGRWDRPEDFARRGFITDLRSAGVAADAVAVDAHLGYYRRGTVLTRLRHDVLQPARGRGYAAVWLVGISLGGTGAVLYDFTYPREVDGLFLIAPFLGEERVVRAVAEAGGPGAFAGVEGVGSGFEHDLWRWAGGLAQRPAGAPAVYLGFGRDDQFAPAHRLLAQALPPAAVFAEAGGHDWQPWRAVWRRFLASGALDPCRGEGAKGLQVPGFSPPRP